MSGLNVEKFVVNTALSLLSKLLGSSTTQFTNSSLAETLSSLGNTYETVSNLGTISADNVLNGVVNSYFNSSGLNRLFGQINLNPNEYASNIRPDTKINQNGGEGTSIYPQDLGPYYISFHFKKYVRPAPFNDSTEEIVKSIYLPIPKELIEQHTMAWEQFKGGALGAIADVIETGQIDAGAAVRIGARAGEGAIAGYGLAKGAQMAEAGITKTLISPSRAAGIGAFAGFAPELPNVFSSSIGGTINPNLAVAFDGPTLREGLTFSWEFSPNNDTESAALKDILNSIKQMSLPSLGLAGSAQFLAYPHIVETRIHPNDLILYKQAVVQNVIINYAPQGIPSFFKDTREPTFISFTMTLREIEYFLSEDFGGTSGDLTEKLEQGVHELLPGLVTGAAQGVVDQAKAFGSLVKGVF